MLELGINLIDTAPVYGSGSAEEVTGEVLKGIRDKVILSTKCGIKLDGPPGARRVATREEIHRGCEASLKRLGTDYIDVVFVHWPDPNTPLEETMSALNTLKAEGKIRYIGLSNFTVPLLEEAHKHTELDVIQPPFSMVDQSAKEVILWAYKHNIMSATYGSLGAGILGGKIRTLTTFGEGDVRGGFYPFFKEPGFSKVMELLKSIDKISEARNAPHSQVAINWVTQKEFVLTALVGVRTEEHAVENCGAMNWSLNADEMAILDDEVERLFGNN
jgi:aryl-alcohol dehydrogenase-like predicted oxidoreductase